MESKDCRFTIGYTYYDEPDLLSEQIKLWNRYPHQIEIILVDDGSQKYPAEDYISLIEHPGFHLYKVDEDLGFNSHGCRNLIAHISQSDNILFSDIDCQFSPETIAFLKQVSYNKEKFYKFCFYSSKTFVYEQFPGHPNVFIVNKEKFWEAGGYDESFTGWHTGDREFLVRLNAVATQTMIERHLGFTVVRAGRKTVIDNTVSKIQYDNDNMIITIPGKMPKDLKGTVTKKINFSYSKIL